MQANDFQSFFPENMHIPVVQHVQISHDVFLEIFPISGSGLSHFTMVLARKLFRCVGSQTIPTSPNNYPTIPNITQENPAWMAKPAQHLY